MLVSLSLALLLAPPSERGDVLYRMTLLRAAPGRLLEVVAELKAQKRDALILRHSQGDQWDLMVLAPVGSYEKHFAQPAAAAPLADASRLAFQEDTFVRGPDLRALPGFDTGGLYHVEM